MMELQFFGGVYPDERPLLLYSWMEEVEIPVGLRCLRCDEEIAPGDKGFIQSAYVRQDDEGQLIHTREPLHLECHLRASIGSVKHQRHECGCYTKNFSLDDDAEYATQREAARAAMAEFEQREGISV